MVLLDTNVLSEFMRPQPSAQVVSWLDRQPAKEVWISAISRAEIELGLALMPRGKRQAALARAAQAMFDEDFAGRCLPFDEVAASHYARIVSLRIRAGRPISVEDAQIAAIALAHNMVLATRNTADFARIKGLVLVNPWMDGA
ncbi:type II toxin-antitoxin system VapC family toxin [Meiothermus rufus]|uniref:type II toxin-antitoxin system VapC family toxin n=1 Tax=Meiothermus rufus TaxID=604332 RepID=UPI0004174326|nr:type II toxin-antitoxin system VapC family toxin [Meiothermus rufus]